MAVVPRLAPEAGFLAGFFMEDFAGGGGGGGAMILSNFRSKRIPSRRSVHKILLLGIFVKPPTGRGRRDWKTIFARGIG
jgi:hypothetical protein